MFNGNANAAAQNSLFLQLQALAQRQQSQQQQQQATGQTPAQQLQQAQVQQLQQQHLAALLQQQAAAAAAAAAVNRPAATLQLLQTMNAAAMMATPQQQQQAQAAGGLGAFRPTQEQIKATIEKFQADVKKYEEMLAQCTNPGEKQRLMLQKQKISQQFFDWKNSIMSHIHQQKTVAAALGLQQQQQQQQQQTQQTQGQTPQGMGTPAMMPGTPNLAGTLGANPSAGLTAAQLAALAQLNNTQALRQLNARGMHPGNLPLLALQLNQQAALQQQQQQQQQMLQSQSIAAALQQQAAAAAALQKTPSLPAKSEGGVLSTNGAMPPQPGTPALAQSTLMQQHQQPSASQTPQLQTQGLPNASPRMPQGPTLFHAAPQMSMRLMDRPVELVPRQPQPEPDTKALEDLFSPRRTKRKLEQLTSLVDPDLVMDTNTEEFLLKVADQFMEKVITSAVKLCKHRNGSSLDVQDVQIPLEKNWNLRIPGIAEETRQKKNSISASYQAKASVVKRCIAEANSFSRSERYREKSSQRIPNSAEQSGTATPGHHSVS